MSLKEMMVAFCTLTKKEINRVLRIWGQTLLPPAISQTLYLVVFGTYIGSRVGEMGGLPYISFLVPGLVMMTVITSSFNNVVSSFFGAKFQKSIEELLISPTPNLVIMAGYTAGGIFRGVVSGAIVFLISVFFTAPSIHSFLFIFLFAVITSVIFSLAGLLNGLLARRFDEVGIFLSFILTPLIYLGGVFYSIKDLPEFWFWVSRFNPIVYMVDGFRYGFYGVSELGLWIDFIVLFGFLLLFGVVNGVLFRLGFRLKE